MKTQVNETKIYHERQDQFDSNCGLHTLNNLLGEKIFQLKDLNSICYQLSDNIINPHKHIFGGDFDVNILIFALQQQGRQCVWIDERKKEQAILQERNKQKLQGFLVNIEHQNKGVLGFMKKIVGLSGRHWFAIKKIEEKYYILDSKKQSPELLKSVDNFLMVQLELGSYIISVCTSS